MTIRTRQPLTHRAFTIIESILVMGSIIVFCFIAYGVYKKDYLTPKKPEPSAPPAAAKQP